MYVRPGPYRDERYRRTSERGTHVESKIVEVQLPNGGVALVQSSQVDGGATKTGIEKLDFRGVAKTLEGIATVVQGAIANAAPTKASVELGLDLAVKSGMLVGLIVDGETSASLKVTLEWERGHDTTADSAAHHVASH